MRAHDVYRAQKQASWTRIEMLLALYDGTLDRLKRASEAQRDGDELQFQAHRMRALRMVSELRAGLDARYGELPQRLDQLLEFVQHRLLEPEPDLPAARTILETLRSGYEGIREEAIRMEAEGAIPPVADGVMVVRRV